MVHAGVGVLRAKDFAPMSMFDTAFCPECLVEGKVLSIVSGGEWALLKT